MSAQVFTSFDAVTAVGPGAAVTFRKPTSPVSLQVITTGSPSEAFVVLEGSLDGVNFAEMVTPGAGGGGAALNPNGFVGCFGLPVIAARAHLTALLGGTSPMVTALICGDD